MNMNIWDYLWVLFGIHRWACPVMFGWQIPPLSKSVTSALSRIKVLITFEHLNILAYNILEQELAFAFISDEGVEPVRALYKIGVGNGGEEILVPM